MKPLRLLLLLPILLASVCFGQFGGVQQPMLAPTSVAIDPTTALPAGIALWWVASDLSSTPVSTWTDRKQNEQFTQSGAARPTWDTNGVHFNGSSQEMTNNISALPNWGTGAILAIMKLNSTAATKSIWVQAQSGGQIIFGIGSSGYLYEQAVGDNGVGPLTTNRFDFLSCCNNLVGPKHAVYTNGVLTQRNNIDAWNNIATAQKLGSSGGGNYMDGDWNELIIWTNTGVWTATMISNVHWYATNAYSSRSNNFPIAL